MEKGLDNKTILITGYKGFVGKNLINYISNNFKPKSLLLFDTENTENQLIDFCDKADILFHLAAVQRPSDSSEYKDNITLTDKIINFLSNNKKCVVFFSSSIQSELNNPYGESKRIEERKLLDFGKKNGNPVYIFRFPNLFGTMSKINYTSVVSTFCFNTSHNIPISINDPSTIMKFAYIVNVIELVIDTISNSKESNKIYEIEDVYNVSLGELAYYMGVMKNDSQNKIVRNDNFVENLQIVYKWFEEL